jgi:ABC-2 type transport system permease protein
MNIALAIAIKDIKEAFRNKSTYIYIAFLFFISFPYLSGLGETLAKLIEQGTNTAILQAESRSFLNVLMYTLPMTLSMLFCTYLSAYALILEKAKRTLESLLATPASLRQVWVGKSLAVFMPSIIVAILVVIISIIALNIVVIIPKTDGFLLPDILPTITGLLIIPAVTFGLVMIVSVLQLIMSNPRIGNFAFIGFFLGFYMLTITGVSSSWDFSLIYLAVIAVLIIVNVLLSRLFTKDRVVLSSKA